MSGFLFHDEGDASLELGHRGYGQFIECFDRYGDYLALGLIWGIVERKDGCKGRKARFLFDGARIIRRSKAEYSWGPLGDECGGTA